MNGNGGLARRTEGGTSRPKKPAQITPANAPKHHGEHPSYKARRWAK